MLKCETYGLTISVVGGHITDVYKILVRGHIDCVQMNLRMSNGVASP